MRKQSAPSIIKGRPPAAVAYTTRRGRMFLGDSKKLLANELLKRLKGKVNLIFTSPPFPLNNKKKYGNQQGEEYLEWLREYSQILTPLLTPDGSIVMEVGNSWQKGKPIMSTLAVRSLLAFQEASDLNLCQEFVWSNPARLPSPAAWVTIKRIRVKDSFTKIWWMAPSEYPKADNKRVLLPYSESMEKLLKSKKYNSGTRPSEHKVNATSFLKNNKGSIPGSVLTYPNTSSKNQYLIYCKENNLTPHPARMPVKLAEFFINYLTDPGDIILDPFGGSNVTGFAAESLSRQWISIEADRDYAKGSMSRFSNVKEGPALTNSL